MDLYNIFDAINEAALSSFAKLIDTVQDTPWWKDHLAEKDKAEWDSIVADAAAFLPQDERYKKHAAEMFKTQVQYVLDCRKATPASSHEANPRTLLRIAAKAIKYITPLISIIGVQPLSGPVGLYFHMSSNQEQDPMRMRLEVKKQTTTAMTRRLQARWSPEAMQDLSAVHGLDFEDEIAEVMGREISFEIINEMLTKVCLLALPNETKVSGAKFEGAKLMLEINRAANKIAAATLRGPGNFIVCSPLVLASLQGTKGVKFVSATQEETPEPFYGDVSTLMYCGTLNETIKVYATIAPGLKDKVLVGFKGAGDIDTGLVYCPYVPFMMSGVVIDPMTFSPQISTMTRYGLGTPENGAAYYQLLDVEAMIEDQPITNKEEE